ncbi:adenylate cyclase, class 2 [Thermomonospora echinospora]|uniref:Adenylate cyclase, class 2 n=1 Tax=Thermomonospora echinospora TaxID=1992 RepID=A0A1H6AWU2_9ACTN|nr:class IV adenylate cyclase [Thermomonospora echinospora]SEG52515.1 adenylate cyclase, class 2 [Thermomonospora echinospora]
MREVEVKFRVRDVESLLVALKAQGIELGEPTHQDDQAYAPVGWRFGDSKLGVSFVRLRTVDGRDFFALKQPGENAQACLEYETEVADREQMHQAIVNMGFYATVRVAKTRRTATVGDITICVDDLEGVGTFLELERMIPDDASAIETQRQLAAFVARLGIDAEHTEETYDSLVRAVQE